MPNEFAVSTWSLHRLLGISHSNGPGEIAGAPPQPTWGNGTCELIDLPGQLTLHDFKRVEICHFHLANLEKEYLRSVGKSFATAGVTIQTLLIDAGDLTDPSTAMRDQTWIEQWIEAAAEIGAENARVIAGKSKPNAQTIAMSVKGLRKMSAIGRNFGVRVVTENWFELLASPKEVHQVLDALEGEVGFLADTGNWHGAAKYADLESVFARAELCHAKCSFGTGLAMDKDDFGFCIAAAQQAGYAGPYTLIYDGPDEDEWAGLAMERRFIQEQMLANAS